MQKVPVRALSMRAAVLQPQSMLAYFLSKRADHRKRMKRIVKCARCPYAAAALPVTRLAVGTACGCRCDQGGLRSVTKTAKRPAFKMNALRGRKSACPPRRPDPKRGAAARRKRPASCAVLKRSAHAPLQRIVAARGEACLSRAVRSLRHGPENERRRGALSTLRMLLLKVSML